MIPSKFIRSCLKDLWFFLFILALHSPILHENIPAKQESNSDQLTLSSALSDDSTSPSLIRPFHWAIPIEKPGLPNLHKVSEDLYRGAQPTARGFRELQSMGIKTVINLRSYHSDRSLLIGTRLKYIRIKTQAWHIDEDDMIKFLKIVTDKNRTPVFIHCQHGADRTGTFSAIYRMAVEGWSKEEAISEMTKGGFGYHTVWRNLIYCLKTLDIEKIKKKTGLASSP